MRFHLEMKARDCGRASAQRQLGNVALLQGDSRSAWGWSGIEAWLADLKYALRALAKEPGFTAVAVATMMLGIGATTAVFSVANAVLLRPLPFPQPDRLAMIWETRERTGDKRTVVSYPNFQEWQAQSQSFEHMGVLVGDGVRTWTDGEPAWIDGSAVSEGVFRALGVQPVLGRAYLREEFRADGPKVMVLSYGLWQRLGSRSLTGKAVPFDRGVFTVVGVMPRGFDFPPASEFWCPFLGQDPRNNGGNHYLRVLGRLKAGATMTQAWAEMQTIAARLRQAHPQENQGIGANVVPLLEQPWVTRGRRS
jgi:putative ABC transport system permease protein